MLPRENNYDFRKTMCRMHKRIPNWRARAPRGDEYVFPDEPSLCLDFSSEVAELAARDFIAYLKTAFGLRAHLVREGAADLTLSLGDDLGEAAGYAGRRTVVAEGGITVTAFDERGAAQALYSIEERLNARRAPYLALGETAERPRFSPRMIHSGWGLDEYPDEYLAACAHHGFDAIILFVKDAHHSAHGECDFADIVRRAARYGIDAYAYSYVDNFVHPSDEGAAEKFDAAYGSIFRAIPGLRGMIFVGESIEFPSRDPHVCKRRWYEKPADGIPDGRATPGWWPCTDYPEWLSLVRDSIRRVSPEADVVFWTYNFGYVDAEHRTALLRTLPTDVSLLVTFEMFDMYKMGNGVGQIMDYTVSRTGPGFYFTSEAEVAAERGIRLYAMVNTAGRTWDFGVAPYEPFPYQWGARHARLIEAQEKWGLAGLMESHHFGFYPSFISLLAKNDYTLGAKTLDEKMEELAREYAGAESEKFLRAMRLASEAITHYVPSDESQYGPFRVGPAYPFCLIRNLKLPDLPGANFGNGIYNTYAGDPPNNDLGAVHSPFSVRVQGEIEEIAAMKKLLAEALAELRSIKIKNRELERLINLFAFLVRCSTTAINAKRFYVLRHKLFAAETNEKLAPIVRAIERLCRAEIENARAALPLVDRDSALGFEPCMLYQCDRRGIEWKIRQVEYMLNTELSVYKNAAANARRA